MIADYHKEAREVTLVLTPEEYKAIHLYLLGESRFYTSFIEEASDYIKKKDARDIIDRLGEIHDEIDYS